MLTEVRVPLKQDSSDGGYWADAQEVTEELQKGPSRIDGEHSTRAQLYHVLIEFSGRAKVYTLRGKYKQYFLRISEDGEQVCQPANLKVAPDRTLEIFIEDVRHIIIHFDVCLTSIYSRILRLLACHLHLLALHPSLSVGSSPRLPIP